MKILVTSKDVDLTFDTIVVAPSDLNLPQFHLYAMSNNIDCVVVDMEEDVPTGKLRHLMTRVRVTPRLPETITPHTITLLSEVYPDKAAEFRYAFMRDRNNIRNVLVDFGTKMNWSYDY